MLKSCDIFKNNELDSPTIYDTNVDKPQLIAKYLEHFNPYFKNKITYLLYPSNNLQFFNKTLS